MANIQNVLVTGACGYVGSNLVPRLLKASYKVKALDLMIYGETLSPHPNLEIIQGDIRDQNLLFRVMADVDAVIHLACISNDPGYDLNPALGQAINYYAFRPLVIIARDSGVKRFIYASSSSVYGIQDAERVTEYLPLKPLTDYSKFKALCEDVLLEERAPGFTTLILRPATVSGYSPRFRLDVVVNTLTLQALASGRIKVLGGQQKRANLHMADMCQAYVDALQWPSDLIDGQTFNIGAENYKVLDLADRIRARVGGEITCLPSNDPRSYSLCSDKIKNVLGFTPQHTLEQAIDELAWHYRQGHIVDPLTNPRYYNVQLLKMAGLK